MIDQISLHKVLVCLLPAMKEQHKYSAHILNYLSVILPPSNNRELCELSLGVINEVYYR